MSIPIIDTWSPSVEVESANGVREVQIMTKLVGKRKLFLTGEVDVDMANKFIAQMMYLTDSGEDIDIYINSPGGSVDVGMAIVDTIKACENTVSLNLYCIGMAASISSFN